MIARALFAQCADAILTSPRSYARTLRGRARYEPGSKRRVLSNLLGIRSAREMNRAEERELVRATGWALHAYESERRISVEDLCNLHRKWLGGIYPWAGEYRQVNVSKGGFMFAAAGQIPRLMQEFEVSVSRSTRRWRMLAATSR